MDMNSYRTRRATVDDLAQLAELWRSACLPAEALEKEFTDFQVAEDADGKILGAIGLRIESGHGKIHSEAFFDFGLTDTLRPALWERLQMVVKNHGLFRLWTKEAAPWWKKDAGFAAPETGALEKLPAAFGAADGAWLTLRLRNETAEPDQIDKEIAKFKEAERIKLEKIIRRGKAIKNIGIILAGLLFCLAVASLFYTLKHRG